MNSIDYPLSESLDFFPNRSKRASVEVGSVDQFTAETGAYIEAHEDCEERTASNHVRSVSLEKGPLSKPFNKLLVGLTGGIGSGKSLVANSFAERGASVIDTDVISHQLTAANGAAILKIRSTFGDQVITPDGALDRAKMRALIFSDATQKSRLEAILHPMIRADALRQTEIATGLYVIYVIPLLAEKHIWNLSRILVVDCDEQLQIQRVKKRDGLSEAMIQSIIEQQATRAERLAIANDVLYNQTTYETLIPEIDRLHRLYCQLALTN